MLPNFLYIGAQKCGTTSLWKILNAHPDVFLASPRETQFFHDDLQYSDGAQSYEYRYFSNWSGQKAVGEKCPEYLYVPAVAERIRHTLGSKVKFVVTLRSPAQRAFSHYRHNLAALRETRTFEEAIAEEAAQLRRGNAVPVPFGYLGRGLYAQQLMRFLEQFHRDQFLILDFDSDVCGDQRAVAQRLYRFLDLPPFFPPGLPFREGRPQLKKMAVRFHEDNVDPRRQYVEIARGGASQTRGLKGLVRRLAGYQQPAADTRRIYQPSESLIRLARNFQQLRSADLTLTPAKEADINQRYFHDDVTKLQTLVTFDVSTWIAETSTDAVGSSVPTGRAAA